MKGIFYGIGVGPGDPDLLTLKAYKVLEKVDLVCIPKSRMEKESVALNIVEKALERKLDILELHFPMTKDQAELARNWDSNTEKIVEQLNQGKSVALITIGDPLLYSTYSYVMKRILKNHPEIKVETIPGISSAFACASELNVILTEEEESLGIVPANADKEYLLKAIQSFDNLFLMKVAKSYDLILEILEEVNFHGQAYLISRCGHPDQLITSNLQEMKGKEIHYLSSMLIKKGVK